MAMASSGQQEFIYCILLPFRCTSLNAPSNLDFILRGVSPPPGSESVVAKVGITKNPAKRFSDIYYAFQEFGEAQPLLDYLSSSDNSQTVITKAKSVIIFIEKVHNLGTAEKDIRDNLVKTTVHLGQPQLKQAFLDSFKAKVPQEKKDYLEAVGMTEWIILSSSLAVNLRQRFRSGGIWRQGSVPSGVQLTYALSTYNRDFSRGKTATEDRIILGSSGKCLQLLFEFKPLEFHFCLNCQQLQVMVAPGP